MHTMIRWVPIYYYWSLSHLCIGPAVAATGTLFDDKTTDDSEKHNSTRNS